MQLVYLCVSNTTTLENLFVVVGEVWVVLASLSSSLPTLLMALLYDLHNSSLGTGKVARF